MAAMLYSTHFLALNVCVQRLGVAIIWKMLWSLIGLPLWVREIATFGSAWVWDVRCYVSWFYELAFISWLFALWFVAVRFCIGCLIMCTQLQHITNSLMLRTLTTGNDQVPAALPNYHIRQRVMETLKIKPEPVFAQCNPAAIEFHWSAVLPTKPRFLLLHNWLWAQKPCTSLNIDVRMLFVAAVQMADKLAK